MPNSKFALTNWNHRHLTFPDSRSTCCFSRSSLKLPAVQLPESNRPLETIRNSRNQFTINQMTFSNRPKNSRAHPAMLRQVALLTSQVLATPKTDSSRGTVRDAKGASSPHPGPEIEKPDLREGIKRRDAPPRKTLPSRVRQKEEVNRAEQHLKDREKLAPRARFELAIRRGELTDEPPISPELAGVGANRRNSASCDETGRITFSFFLHLSFAYCRHSPLLLLRFHDGAKSSTKAGRASVF